MLAIRQLHWPSWIGIHGGHAGLQPLGMGHDGLEVFDRDTYAELLFHNEFFEIQRVDGDRGA